MRSSTGQAALLHDRGFCYLLVGHFLSALAPTTQRAAVLLWVYAMTGSGAAVGLVGVAEGLALVGVAPFAGVLADRWDRARTMAGVVLVQAALLLPLLGVRDAGGLPVLLAVTLLVNAASQFFLPAATAALPVVVGRERVGPANGLLQTATSLVLLTAPGLAAGAFATIGPRGLVVALIALYLAAAPILALVPAGRSSGAPERRPAFRVELRAGLGYVAARPALIALAAVALTATLGTSALGVLDVVFVTRALGHPPELAAVLLTATGVGHLLGGTLIALLGSRLRGSYHRLLGGAVAAEGVTVLAYALAPALTPAAAALFVLGVLYVFAGVSFVTLLQLGTEDAYLGRVVGLVTTAMATAAIVSTSAGGLLADALGIRHVLAATALCLFAAGALSLLFVRETPELGPATV